MLLGFDFRPVWSEVSSARVKSEIGLQYLDGKLHVSGRTPIPAPDDRPIEQKATKDFLPTPLKHLSINVEGHLVLPTLANLPVKPTPELVEVLEKLAQEFPQTTTPTSDGCAGGAGAGETTSTSGGSAASTSGGSAGTGEGTALAPGTPYADRAALVAAGWNIVKESPTPDPRFTYLLASNAGVKQIFFENKGDKADLGAGTYMGKGGAGHLIHEDEVSENLKPKAWRYTRIFGFKKDTHKWANGSFVHGPLGDDKTPDMMTLAQAEQTIGVPPGEHISLYGHCVSRGLKRVQITPGDPPVCWVPAMKEGEDGSSFSAIDLGQWLLSREIPSETEGQRRVECKGLLRPAFEMIYDPAQRQLAPSARADANALSLFCSKEGPF